MPSKLYTDQIQAAWGDDSGGGAVTEVSRETVGIHSLIRQPCHRRTTQRSSRGEAFLFNHPRAPHMELDAAQRRQRRWWLIEVRYAATAELPPVTGRALGDNRPPAQPGPHPLARAVARHEAGICLAWPLWRGVRRLRRQRLETASADNRPHGPGGPPRRPGPPHSSAGE